MRLLQRSFVCFAAALALALAHSAYPQDKPAAPAKEAAKPVAPKPEAKQPAKAMSKERLSRRQQDARHCLEQPSNTAIIKCAEAYL
jgi:hypothetical protein